MLITRKIEFSASHLCRNPGLSDRENEALYGAEANPRGHGHNFAVDVTLEGDPDPVTGMVYDLKKLKQVLQAEVVDPFDHRFLNVETPPFDRVIPTIENLAVEIWRRVAPHFTGTPVRLHSVRVAESEDLYVECYEAQG
jgi:6-pyruvoyltetrahydropterin/6-carboxytetrahydropterin synthase